MFPLLIVIFFLPVVALAHYTPSPRWAQAVALLENTLYVHGGLNDPFNSISYSSASRTSDLLVLDLSISFNSSSPPWQLFSSNSSPALAWHTLSAFDASELLLFGGQPGPNSLTVITDLSDSAYLLSTSGKFGPSFLTQPQNWANEPMRRIRHSASFASGKVWLIGGEKPDGSGNAFSDHYFFNPSGSGFVQLPLSRTAPPDIYGHTSLVLPDGRLLVFGGFCASCSRLVPMDTIWSLNTTQNPPIWENLPISNESLPSPRRDFAAVVLLDDQVLIHGGGDAQLQTTYSDGWILDTGQNPMVWKNVAALAELGQRKDHFAVQAGGFVLICFGYSSSSPAPASLFIYDPAASAMVTSYIAPTPGSPSVVTSLSGPIPTESTPNSNGGTGTASGSSTGTPSHVSGSSSGTGQHTAAIALWTTLGIFAIVAGGLAMIYYLRRARNRDQRSTKRFVPLAGDLGFSLSDGLLASAAPHLESETNERVRGVTIMGIAAYLGISKTRSQAPQPRKDMFVDEDNRSFGWVGRSSTVQRQGSEGTSVWSFRSVGALVRGVIGNEPSRSGANQGDREWEKNDHHREEGQEGLIRQGSLRSQRSSHPTHRRDGSSWSYTDPFEDPILDDGYGDLSLQPGTSEKDMNYDHSVRRSHETDNFEQTALGPQDSAWPFTEPSHTLTPLREMSHVSLLGRSNLLQSWQEQGRTTHRHADYPALSPPSPTLHSPTTSRSSHAHVITQFPRHSNSTLSHSQSISRPDSWWSRLTKPPLLDRRTSNATSKPLGFRDPTPAPPFVVSEKTKNPSSTPAHSNDMLVDAPVIHHRSLDSAHSGRTANTDSAEHLGGAYDVVQRLTSDGSSSRRAPSLGSAEITEQGLLAIDNAPPSAISMSGALPHVDPPRSTSVPVHPAMSLDVEAPPQSLISPGSDPSSPKKGAIVAGRIQAYERRLSRETEPQQPPSPRNTRRREEIPSRSRPTIQYGVAPRASLFIANPDLGHIS